MNLQNYQEYAQHIGADGYVFEWINTMLKNYLEKNKATTEEVEHILDFFISDAAPKRISRMSYEEAKASAEKWTKSLQKKGAQTKEVESDTEVVLDFKDGFKIVKLIGRNARQVFCPVRECYAGRAGADVCG